MSNVQLGTLGGTLCSLWISFDWSNLIQTIIMAVLGGCVKLFDQPAIAR